MPSRSELIEWLDGQHGYSEQIVDALLARWPHIAGPERVEAVEELPEFAIIRDGQGRVLMKYQGRWWEPLIAIDDHPHPDVTVLFRPDATNPEEGTR